MDLLNAKTYFYGLCLLFSLVGWASADPSATAAIKDLSTNWHHLSSFVACSNRADVSCTERLSTATEAKSYQELLDDPRHIAKRAARFGSCQDALSSYATAGSKFVECSVNYSRPILLCEKCVDEYLHAQAAFTDYAETKDESGHSCDDIVFGSDLIEVVHRANQSIESLWSDSHCAYCFNSYTIRHGTVIFQFSENLIIFIQKHTNLTNCFADAGVIVDTTLTDTTNNATNASLVCKECYPYYKDLSDFFIKNYTEDVTKTCMDVVDLMNQTRRMWGHWFQCEDRHPSRFLPWTVATIIFATSIVFYIGMFFNTTFEYYVIRRQDRLVTATGGPYGAINESTSSNFMQSYANL